MTAFESQPSPAQEANTMQSEKWDLNRLDLWAEVALNLLNEAGAVFKGDDSYLAPRPEAALSAAEPVAAMTTDYLGCEYVSMDVAGIEKIAAAHSKGPTEVVYLYSAPPAPSVAVKALEWNPYRAETPFGWYQIEDQRSVPESALKGRPPFLLFGSRMDYSRHATLEAARAAAQADYEARIRSALSAQVQDVAILVAEIVEAKTPAAQQIYGFDIRFFDALRGLPIGTKLYAAVPQGTSDVKQMGGGR